jgi:hypothetical protein
MTKMHIISRALSAYEKAPLSDEYRRAFLEFSADIPSRSVENEEAQQLFHEWFIFHFRLFSGRTPLEQFILNSENHFSDEEYEEAEVLRHARFDLFEVCAAIPGQEMTVQGLSDDAVHRVIEHRGSEHIRPGAWIFGRVGSWPDRAEFVGGVLVELPVKLMAESREHWKKMFHDVDPKAACEYLLGTERGRDLDGQAKQDAREKISLTEARDRLVILFKKYDIEKFVTVPQVEKWCNQRRPDTSDPRWIMGLVLGLANDAGTAFEDFVQTVQVFVNAVPRDQLHGLSPRRAAGERGSDERKPESFINYFYAWNDHAKQAHQCMAAGQTREAIEAYRHAFQSLLESRTTIRDVFRLYANTAIALFAYGDEYGGRALLNRAYELNPLYDFAVQQSERLAAGEFDDSILYGRTSALADIGYQSYRQMHNRKGAYEQESWYQYDQKLKRFKINFHHPLDEPTPLTFFRQDGRNIGRSESCPCGSGKKFKKCHGL